MHIETITSRQILDSRGNPTLETRVTLDTGDQGTASVPSGASTGAHEALELRDGGESYGGRSVLTAVKNVTGPIAKVLKGQDVRDQRAIDQAMIEADGTVNKSALGANAILSVSLAVARAHAALERKPLYESIRASFGLEVQASRTPAFMFNILNGGKHSDNGLKVQEYLVIPEGDNAAERLERGVAVYASLWTLLHTRQLSTLLGDEGGFAPSLKDDRQALELIVEAINGAGLKPGHDVWLGLDMAASTFYDAGKDRYVFGPEHGLSATGMMGVIDEWRQAYPIKTIEDPLAEDDWANWTDLTAKVGETMTIIGDDLFVTSVQRLDRGIDAHAANAILIKPNQIGTLSETVAAVERARAAGYKVIASHRSGETTDDFITDFAYAIGADYLKAGAPARGERVAKYNRALAIEAELRS